MACDRILQVAASPQVTVGSAADSPTVCKTVASSDERGRLGERCRAASGPQAASGPLVRLGLPPRGEPMLS
jgi:hypothetical protein